MNAQYPNARELRDWANAKQPGIVQDKGHLPRFVILAWDKAHPDRPYVKAQAHHGTARGYGRGCRCDRCLDVGRRNGRERYRTDAEERAEVRADDLLGGPR